MGAPAARVSELAKHWANEGHDITVLTGFPNHPTGTVPQEYRSRLRRLVVREDFCGVNLVRTWLWPLPNRKAHERILNYSSFCVSSAITGLALRRPEVVIGTSPQLLVALSGYWLARAKRAPFIFEVRDLWPESLAAVGQGNESSFLHRTLFKIAGFLYRRSDHIVVVTPAFKAHLISCWNVPPEKISVIENGVETELFAPGTDSAKLRTQLNVLDRFVICYIGTMGNAHGLETVLSAAETLRKTFPAALFLLIGEGAEKERIQAMAACQGLSNVQFLEQQPRERVPDFIAAADSTLVLLKKNDLFKTVIPTKMLEFMSCARPVVLGVDGQAREILESGQAGVYCEPENANALSDAIVRLASHPTMRQVMSDNGRMFILEHYSRARTAKAYLSVLSALIGKKNAVEPCEGDMQKEAVTARRQSSALSPSR